MTITGCTTSHLLASQMETLLLSLGLGSTQTTIYPAQSNRRTVYHLNIRGEAAFFIAEYLGELLEGWHNSKIKNRSTGFQFLKMVFISELVKF